MTTHNNTGVIGDKSDSGGTSIRVEDKPDAETNAGGTQPRGNNLSGSQPSALDPPPLHQVSGVQVIVRQETPFLPKVAFVLISLASLAGAVFTGMNAGLTGVALVARWLSLWGLGLAGGFAVWRLFYLRNFDPEATQSAVDNLNATALALAHKVSRIIAVVTLVGTVGLFTTGYLSAQHSMQWLMIVLQLALSGALAVGVNNRNAASVVAATTLALLGAWAWVDTGGYAGDAAIRLVHLTAFSLWLGGAVWNIWVAMPAGRAHPNFDAVIAGAHQLDRFRWVVRFALPTIIITGLIMAFAYRTLPAQWWLHLPGILIPGKVAAIIVLVVVFITCPLFRHCSPVQGVCNLDDLSEGDGAHAP